MVAFSNTQNNKAKYKYMCGSGYIQIKKNKVGRQGFYFILYIYFTLILWERHCDFNGAYCKMASKYLGQGIKIRVGRVTGTTHIFYLALGPLTTIAPLNKDYHSHGTGKKLNRKNKSILTVFHCKGDRSFRSKKREEC